MPTKKAPAGGKAVAPKAKSGKGAAGGEAAASGAGGKRANALQKPLQPSKELAAVAGSEPLGACRGGEPGLGVHQAAPAAEPGEPPRDPGRRQAGGSVRHEQGHHV